MAGGKVTAIAFLIMFIVVCSDISSVMVANAQTMQCCHDNRIGSCLTGSAIDNRRCNSLCTQCSDKGGKCNLLKSGQYLKAEIIVSLSLFHYFLPPNPEKYSLISPSSSFLQHGSDLLIMLLLFIDLIGFDFHEHAKMGRLADYNIDVAKIYYRKFIRLKVAYAVVEMMIVFEGGGGVQSLIQVLQFMPKVITGSEDGSMRVMDCRKGKCNNVIDQEKQMKSKAAFSWVRFIGLDSSESWLVVGVYQSGIFLPLSAFRRLKLALLCKIWCLMTIK
ncbi:hypothetical protein MKW98_013520 [Papaver atlanticum]|uniref:Uncharacterized protein n=1 Tax=Papaver atlanticum TaxID=357466 RepID=A0AAD4STG5_9MAGN|nr:hypothetical protein MKW98_013520 [Papaver atlanticum]